MEVVCNRTPQLAPHSLLSNTTMVAVVLALFFLSQNAQAFATVGPSRTHDLKRIPQPPVIFAGKEDPATLNPDLEGEINKDLEKARSILQKSKAILEQKASSSENGTTAPTSNKKDNVPFFATLSQQRASQCGVVKSVDARTGLITADGERLAQISEAEDWEVRPLDDVFENEIGTNEDVYSLASRQLAKRDVAASMWNLRKQLHTEDYQRIFDRRNRFIGEDA